MRREFGDANIHISRLTSHVSHFTSVGYAVSENEHAVGTAKFIGQFAVGKECLRLLVRSNDEPIDLGGDLPNPTHA